MHSNTDNRRAARVGVVGAGRLGTSLSRALRAAGVDVEGPLGRGEAPRGCDAIVLCVPDGEIEAAAAAVAGAAPLVGHTSGATPLDARWRPPAAPRSACTRSRRSPAPTPTPSPARAVRSPARQPEALAFAADLARTLGMTPFEIDDEGRAAYHAAASVASNFLVTLQAAAERVAAGAGLEPDEARRLLMPLVRQTVENVAAHGPERALTGPIARGDDATVAAQRRAVAEAAPELLDLFDALVAHTRARGAGGARHEDRADASPSCARRSPRSGGRAAASGSSRRWARCTRATCRCCGARARTATSS